MNHNELVGWLYPEEALRRIGVVMLRDKGDHPQIQRRFDLTRDLIAGKAGTVHEVWSEGNIASGPSPFRNISGRFCEPVSGVSKQYRPDSGCRHRLFKEESEYDGVIFGFRRRTSTIVPDSVRRGTRKINEPNYSQTGFGNCGASYAAGFAAGTRRAPIVKSLHL